MKSVVLLLLLLITPASLADDSSQLTMVVMDPLAKPLACDCVQGYAQRKYEHLGSFLQQALKRPVKVVWSESLSKAVEENGPAHIVIGKHSVVMHDARHHDYKMKPLAQLTGTDGSVTQQGYVVVRAADPAKTVENLQGYRFFFGPEDCEEKHEAPMQLLKESGIKLPATLETSKACSTAASTLLELPASEKAAAIISSYAAPLLEGCGTIKKGDLKVIGKSREVPFITAFANAALTKEERQSIRQALLDVELDAEVMIALETSDGFKRWKPSKSDKKTSETAAAKKKSTVTGRAGEE